MRRIVSIILGTAMAVSMLAGCGSKEEAPTAAQTEARADREKQPGSCGEEASQEDGYEFKDTITLICPVKAGGDTDRNARVLAQYTCKYAGVNVVVKCRRRSYCYGNAGMPGR